MTLILAVSIQECILGKIGAQYVNFKALNRAHFDILLHVLIHEVSYYMCFILVTLYIIKCVYMT